MIVVARLLSRTVVAKRQARLDHLLKTNWPASPIALDELLVAHRFVNPNSSEYDEHYCHVP